MATPINVELRRSDGTNYNTLVYIKTGVRMIDGLLDVNEKINASLLPSFIFGGMKFCAYINANNTITEVYNLLTSSIETGDVKDGKYFICTTNITITVDNPDHYIKSDEGEGAVGEGMTIDIEANDWLVYVGTVLEGRHEWAVVNNTYRNATESQTGIIKIASDAEAKAGTNTTKAVTPKGVASYVTNKLGNVDNTSDANKPISTATQTALDGKQPLHADLTSISGIVGTGFLKKSAGAWTLDGTTYVDTGTFSSTLLDYVTATNLTDNYLIQYAPLSSPALLGTPTAPTAPTGTNNTQIATTAFVKSQNYITSAGAPVQSVNGKTGVVTLAKGDVGLGSVLNYGLADTAEAKAGTSNALYMTPVRTKEAINHFASIPLVSTLEGLDATVTGKLVMLQI